MTGPAICATHMGGSPDLPTLVVGPSLGTPVAALWSVPATRLTRTFHVVGWDLPGHGASPPPQGPFTIADLAVAVVKLVNDLVGSRPFSYAGVSVAGAVGLQLLLAAPERIASAALISTAARIGDPDDWRSRAKIVRKSGTGELVAGSVRRWFAAGFFERDPVAARALLNGLRTVDAEGYARTCEALASFDTRDRLGEIDSPVLAIAGANDIITPPEAVRSVATNVRRGRFLKLHNAAHLVPAERPGRIADLLTTMRK